MSEIDKKYLYKVSRNGNHLGNLTNVVSSFGYQQTIRTGGSQMTILIGVTADTADQDVSELLTEDGDPITTEDNQTLTTERVPDVVGDGNEDNLIRNDNTIEVVEFSDYHPNGITVFKGYIAKWKVTFGGTDNIEITVISNGQDMTQYLVEAGDVVDVSQLVHATSSNAYTQVKGNTYYVAQTFTQSGAVNCSAISLLVTTTQTGTLYITLRRRNGSSPNPPGDTRMAYGSVSVGIVSQTEVKVSFEDVGVLADGDVYYFEIGWTGSTACAIRRSSTSVLANGSVWTYYWYGTAYSTATNISTSDLYFKLWEYGGNTTATYTLQDPTYMLTDIMEEYRARGGYIQEPTSPITALVEQEVRTATLPDSYWSNYYGQCFTPTDDMTINLLQLRAKVDSGTGFIYAEIYEGNPDGDLLTVMGGMGTWDNNGGATLVGTGAFNNTFTNTEERDVSIVWDTPIELTGGVEYFISLMFEQGFMSTQTLYGAGAGTTAEDIQVGSLYYANASINNASFSIVADSAYPYLYFKLAYEDPLPNFLSSGYDDTGLDVTYTFQQQTILEAVGVISDFLPYTWYWYVDPSDEVLYCQEVSTTPDHYIIKGRHIDELSIEATKERIANVVYFTGGPVANVNIFVKTQDTTSLENNRVGMVKLSDNRVITTANGTLVNQNYINLHSAEEYISQVTINDSTYDITQFKLGHTIKFQGFGTFMDGLTLQIVGITRSEEKITLDVGVLSKRSSEKVEELDRKLTLQQTLLNPSVPS